MTQQAKHSTIPLGAIVMTGATAGLGAHAAGEMLAAARPLIIGTRSLHPDGCTALALDLSSLASVNRFADRVIATLADLPIAALVLNAGVGLRDTGSATDDGFETTFATNHLAHYLLARRLLPYLAHGGKLIITTSDVHAQAPAALDIATWSRPRKGSGMQAYAISKLCNLLTAQALAVQPSVVENDCQVIAYNPGLTVGTSLSRQLPAWQRGLMNSPVVHAMMRSVSHFIPMVYPGTPQRAGEVLAHLTLGEVALPPGTVYASLVRGELSCPAPSALAGDPAARDALWAASADMVGLSD